MEIQFAPIKIKVAREEKGWSLHKLGLTIRASGQQVGYYETGDTQPRAIVIARLCNALDVEPGYFFSRESDDKREVKN